MVSKQIIRSSGINAERDDALGNALRKIGVQTLPGTDPNVIQIHYDPEKISELFIYEKIGDCGFLDTENVTKENGKIKTDGMTCSSCKETIESQLATLSVTADADFASNEVEIKPYNAEEVCIIGINELLGESKFKQHYQMDSSLPHVPSENDAPSSIEEEAKDQPELFDASAAALSCCIATMAGDLAKVAEVSNASAGKYSSGNMNFSNTKSEIGIGVITAVAGLCGACASLETFSSAGDHVKRLKGALGHVEAIRNFVAESPGRSNDLEGIDAIDLFLKRQLRKAQFVKWVPGATSAATSGSLGLGGIIYKMSPIGLGLACVDNISHIVETTRLIREHEKNKKILENQLLSSRGDESRENQTDIEMQIKEVHKEISTCKKRRYGAVGSAIGGALLIAPSAAAYGAAVTKSPYLLAAAITSLVPGIVMSVAYNPYEDLGWRREFSERLEKFSNDLATSEKSEFREKTLKFFNKELKEELIKGLRISRRFQDFSKKYRADANKNLHKSRRVLNTTNQKLGVLGSRGLSFLSSPVTLLGNFGASSRDRYEKSKILDNGYRNSGWKYINRGLSFTLFPLTKFGTFLGNTASGLERWTQNNVISSLNNPDGFRLSSLGDYCPEKKRVIAEAASFHSALNEVPEMKSEVIKNLAKHSLHANGSLRHEYADIFPVLGTDEISQEKSVHGILRKIAHEADISPCCPVKPPNLKSFDSFYESLKPAHKNILNARLGEAFDRVCFFGKTAKSDGRYYSRMLGAYNTIENIKAKPDNTPVATNALEDSEDDRRVQDGIQGRVRHNSVLPTAELRGISPTSSITNRRFSDRDSSPQAAGNPTPKEIERHEDSQINDTISFEVTENRSREKGLGTSR